MKVDGYHWHVDFKSMEPSLEALLVAGLALYREDFEAGEYIPGLQLSRKFKASGAKEFSSGGRKLREILVARQDQFEGYLELEVVYNDWDIPKKMFDPSVPVPFQVSTRALEPAVFREAEIHVSIDRDRSNPLLIAVLRRMGLYCAELSKSKRMTAAVYTVQGSRKEIEQLFDPLWNYLCHAGGSVAGSIKAEYVPPWGWLRSPMDFPVPPVVSTISWA